MADKTGTGDYGRAKDIAMVWPPNAAPIVMAIVPDRSGCNTPPVDALIAETTRQVVSALTWPGAVGQFSQVTGRDPLVRSGRWTVIYFQPVRRVDLQGLGWPWQGSLARWPLVGEHLRRQATCLHVL